LWIPVTILAALAQTLRNAAQRHLTEALGTLGATLVRFLYGLPFALIWLLAVQLVTGAPLPAVNLEFAGWIVFASFAQIAATALLLSAMRERNFALAVAYAKTEVLQVAIFGFVALGDAISVPVMLAIACGVVGVLLLSPVDPARPVRTLLGGLAARAALLGIASGAGFGLSAVAYRGAALSLEGASFMMAAAFALVGAQLVQTIMLGGWLLAREPAIVGKVLGAWRASLFAGFMGATASAAWFTAFAIEVVAHVRTLGLIEIFFTLVVSRRVFRERLKRLELLGTLLLMASLAVVMLWT
jgi:drug/metabolite transporter (DMT)-like permease